MVVAEARDGGSRTAQEREAVRRVSDDRWRRERHPATTFPEVLFAFPGIERGFCGPVAVIAVLPWPRVAPWGVTRTWIQQPEDP